MVFILGLTGGECNVMLDHWKLLYLLVAQLPGCSSGCKPVGSQAARWWQLHKSKHCPSHISLTQAWPWASPRYPSGCGSWGCRCSTRTRWVLHPAHGRIGA